MDFFFQDKKTTIGANYDQYGAASNDPMVTNIPETMAEFRQNQHQTSIKFESQIKKN